jgi:hypothetical protein
MAEPTNEDAVPDGGAADTILNSYARCRTLRGVMPMRDESVQVAVPMVNSALTSNVESPISLEGQPLIEKENGMFLLSAQVEGI